MAWIERPLLETRLRDAMAGPGPAVVTVLGPSGAGVSGLLRTVLPPLAHRRIAFTATLAAPPLQLERAAAAWARAEVPAAAGPLSWAGLTGALLDTLRRDRRGTLLVVDDAPALIGADEEAREALAALWAGARAHALPLHLVLAGHDAAVVERWTDEVMPGARLQRVNVPLVRIDELRQHLADWLPEERFLIRASLGGQVEALGKVDPNLRATTNLFRLVVESDGPLHDLPPRRLREQFLKPERYTGILGALAEGAVEWADIRGRNPAFRSGNQLAPYLSALQERGWVVAERSLDAPPTSRGRRYRIRDPLVSFWYQVAEPARDRLLAGESPGRVARELPLDAHLERAFPFLCREALMEGVSGHAAPLPLRAREMGGLWGADHELPISGTLRGGAILLGRGVWGRPADEADAAAAVAARRATRYGFGRESRLVLLVTTQGATEGLTRWAARDDHLVLLPLQALF